jgi:hypothetical protein
MYVPVRVHVVEDEGETALSCVCAAACYYVVRYSAAPTFQPQNKPSGRPIPKESLSSLVTMRIPPVAMVLLAVAARGVLYRANSGVFVAAFSTTSRAAFTTRSTDGSSASSTIGRRRRAPHSSDTLLAKVKELQKQGRWSEETMMFSAVEETATEATTTSDDVIAFPQAGKRIEDCAPRMRFAPSPTGR